MKNLKWIIASAMVTTGVVAKAQTTLDSVLVTANKYQEKLEQTGKNSLVITKQTLEENSFLNVSELLQNYGGLSINGAGQVYGSNQSLFLRGSSSGQTLILIDGLPVQDPSNIEGNFDLNLLNLNQFERIEIIKGGQSTLYGSNATAGVINFITKKVDELGTKVYGGVAGGSFLTAKANAGLSNKSNLGASYISGSFVSSKGISSAASPSGAVEFHENGFKNTSVQAGFSPNLKKLSLQLKGTYTHSNSELDLGAFSDEKDYNGISKNALFSTKMAYPVKNGAVNLNYNYNSISRSYLNDSSFVASDASEIFSDANYVSKSNFVDFFYHVKPNDNLKFLVGVEYANQDLQQDYSSVSIYGPYDSPQINRDSAIVDNLSLYGTVSLFKTDLGGIDAGARANNNSLYGLNVTYTLNPYFYINKLKVYGILASSYKNPSLYQLYSPYGNKDLKPEEGQDLQVGLEYRHKSDFVSVDFFNKNLTNMFFFMSLNTEPYGQYINNDKLKINGFELAANKQLGKFNLNANYTYLEPSEKTFFYRRPKHQGALTVSYKPNDKLKIDLVNSFLGERTDAYYNSQIFDTEEVVLKKVLLNNLNVNYFLSKRTSVFLSLQNLGNVNYTEIYGFNSRPFQILAGINFR